MFANFTQKKAPSKVGDLRHFESCIPRTYKRNTKLKEAKETFFNNTHRKNTSNIKWKKCDLSFFQSKSGMHKSSRAQAVKIDSSPDSSPLFKGSPQYQCHVYQSGQHTSSRSSTAAAVRI